MALRRLDRILVRHAGDKLLHENLLQPVQPRCVWGIGTPDYDVYDMNVRIGSHGGKDFDGIERLGAERELPTSVKEDEVYLFYNPRAADGDMSAAQRAQLEKEGEKCAKNLLASIARVGGARVGEAAPANSAATAGCDAALLGALPLMTPDETWVVADPTCKHPLGTIVGVVPYRGSKHGIGVIDGSEVFVTKVAAPADCLGYAANRAVALKSALGLEDPAHSVDVPPVAGGSITPRGSGLDKARAIVARAQRSGRSRADNEKWLREQLGLVDNDTVRGVVRDSFGDSGVMKTTLGELLNKLDALAHSHGTSDREEVGARVLTDTQSPHGVRDGDAKLSAECAGVNERRKALEERTLLEGDEEV